MHLTNESVFEKAGRLFFSRQRVKQLEQELSIAGISMPADSFAGYVAINVIVITLFLTVLTLVYSPLSTPLAGLLKTYTGLPQLLPLMVLVAAFIIVYVATLMLLSTYLLMKADDRRDKLEAVLPDFLTLVASNINAGMTLDQAMWYSAKPEFGLLSKEVTAIIKGSFSGESLENALDTLASRFDSRVFKRTILLLKQASSSGGELTAVLERTADDVRNTATMKKEIAASLVLYEIFVLFAAVIGTPFLFAVAYKLIEVFEKLAPQLGGTASLGGVGMFSSFAMMSVGQPIISSSDFFWFSIPTMFVTALISSFIVSVIRTGTKNQGMKYFPFVLIATFIVYWLIGLGINGIFSTIG
jgi:pilus assembly protein TadC